MIKWVIPGDVGIVIKWNSEGNGGEVESKNGFEERHSARGGSNKLGFTEWRREGGPGQRRAERDTALYSRPGIPTDLSRKRGGVRRGPYFPAFASRKLMIDIFQVKET